MVHWIGRSPQTRKREQQHRGKAAPHRGFVALAGLLFAVLAAGGEVWTQPRGSIRIDKTSMVYGLAVSPDGKTAAALDYGERGIVLWDAASTKKIAVLKREDLSPGEFAFTPDGRSLLVLSSHKGSKGDAAAYNLFVGVWDLRTRTIGRTIDFDSDPDTRGAVFTPDGKSLIVGTASGEVHVFDLATGKEAKVLKCDEPARMGAATALAVSADGKTLAVGTGSGDGSVFLWDLEKGKLAHYIPHASEDYPGDGAHGITLLAFSPDGTRLVSGYLGTIVLLQVWNPATGKNLDFLQIGHAIQRTGALAFSPDGKTLAVGGRSKVELWDVGMGGFRDDFSGRSSSDLEIEYLAFSPDGKTLVSAAKLGPVEFWDVPAGTPKDVRRDPKPPLSGAAPRL